MTVGFPVCKVSSTAGKDVEKSRYDINEELVAWVPVMFWVECIYRKSSERGLVLTNLQIQLGNT